MYLSNWSLLPYMKPESNLSQRLGYLSNAQVTEIRDIPNHWIPLDLLCLISPW